MKYLVTAVVVLTAAVYSNMAFAWETNKPYIKASVGQFNYLISWRVDNNGPDLIEVEDDTISFDINIGFPFTDKLAIEGGFSFITEANWNSRRNMNGNVDAYALTLAMVSRLPISNNFGFLGKIGYYSWEVELTETGMGRFIDYDDSDILAGLGVDFRINKTTSFVAGWDAYHDAGKFAHIGIRFNL